MKMKTILCTIILWAGSSYYANIYGQLSSDLHTLKNVFRKEGHTRWVEETDSRNEFQLLFSGLFLFYKSFVSSQDGQQCSFTPSCSVYGMEAVKEKGVLKGMVLTFDRLTRCNGLSPEKYSIDPETGKFYDPIH